MDNNESKAVSIVINTLDRSSLLEKTLHSFQHLDHANFEVVVVNGPSKDDTAELLSAWSQKIKVAQCPEANLSMSRNIGISAASGDFVAFIDDDAIPEAEWLNQVMDAFDSDEVAAAGGKVYDHTGYSYQYQFANATRLGHGKWQLTEASPHYCYPCAYEFPYLQGTNTVFRKSTLLEIGGFDEEFQYYLDEVDVCLRLVDRGYLIRQLENAHVHHKYAPSYIRTKTAAVYRYPVLKSKIYFSNRYASPYHSQAEIDQDNNVFIQNHRDNVLLCIENGSLTSDSLSKFEKHAEQALFYGKEAAQNPRKLTSQKLLESQVSPFKQFSTLQPKGGKLTIVLLCEDYPPQLLGGIARFTQDKATALARAGHKVHVIARSKTHNTVDYEQGVWVHRINADHQKLSEQAKELKIPQSHWDQSQSFLHEINRIDNHHKVDVVEAPVWNIVGIASLLSKKYKVITSLQTTLKLALPSRPDLVGNPYTMSTFVNPIISAEKYLIEHSDAVLAISNKIAEEIESSYSLQIGAERRFISYLGMPDWRLDSFVEKRQDNENLEVLFVGRLEKRKGVDVLLDVIPTIVDKYPNVNFHIVGDDTIKVHGNLTYRKSFEAKHTHLSSTRVFFHGKVDDEELRRRYASCDIFVAPSRFESFGLIYVEAMMFEKPIIGCEVGGIPEVVVNNETGLLVTPDDSMALEAALDKLIDDPVLRAQLGYNGRNRYQQKFTDTEMALGCLGIYRKVKESVNVTVDHS